MTAAEFGHQARREIFRGADDAERQPPALDALQRIERFLRFAQLLGDAPRMARDFLAGLGEENLLADHLGERQAGLLLELFDLHRDGRLGQMQLLGGA
jgi:hypothetical protein